MYTVLGCFKKRGDWKCGSALIMMDRGLRHIHTYIQYAKRGPYFIFFISQCVSKCLICKLWSAENTHWCLISETFKTSCTLNFHLTYKLLKILFNWKWLISLAACIIFCLCNAPLLKSYGNNYTMASFLPSFLSFFLPSLHCATT